MGKKNRKVIPLVEIFARRFLPKRKRKWKIRERSGSKGSEKKGKSRGRKGSKVNFLAFPLSHFLR